MDGRRSSALRAALSSEDIHDRLASSLRLLRAGLVSTPRSRKRADFFSLAGKADGMMRRATNGCSRFLQLTLGPRFFCRAFYWALRRKGFLFSELARAFRKIFSVDRYAEKQEWWIVLLQPDPLTPFDLPVTAPNPLRLMGSAARCAIFPHVSRFPHSISSRDDQSAEVFSCFSAVDQQKQKPFPADGR
jgi:hypothetical protein